jgi:hypothetical protein
MSSKTNPSPEAAVPPDHDRRSDPRYKFKGVAEVAEKKSGAKIDAHVGDIGPQGCFLDTEKPFPLGTMVTVRITKEPKSIRAEARVVFSSAGKGMGLFFSELDPTQRAILDDWVMSSMETSWLTLTRRRSQRILVKLPVHVMGKNNLGKVFDEDTHTHVASAHGAMVMLETPVRKGQHLTLLNERTHTSLECVVAHIGAAQQNRVEVGVAFMLPSPAFWNATFPPEDWSSHHPDAKSAKSTTR